MSGIAFKERILPLGEVLADSTQARTASIPSTAVRGLFPPFNDVI